MTLLYSLLSFGVRNYAHLTKNAFKLFVSLAWRCTTAKGKFLYGEQPGPLSFTYAERKLKPVAYFARTGRLIERI